MSYVRFSSDNWKSDVYAYESECGYEVHVAGSRYVGDIPPLLQWFPDNHDEWFARYREQMNALEKCDLERIGGELDGKSFTYRTLEDFKDGLIELRKAGYHVPEFVFECIDEEMTAAHGQRG